MEIDRKPDNGCEIQNSACRKNGIMHHLGLVSTVQDRQKENLKEMVYTVQQC